MLFESKFFTLNRVRAHFQAIRCTLDAEYSAHRIPLSD
jgi:hypothetical protein